jgi:hypothetical protein
LQLQEASDGAEEQQQETVHGALYYYYCIAIIQIVRERETISAQMSSWTTRRSEDGGPARSNLRHANNSQSQKQQPGHSTSGSGLLSFLKTELDSFVKGLSGKPDVRTACC